MNTDKDYEDARLQMAWHQHYLAQALLNAIVGGTGVMLGDKRIDPASIYKQPEQEPVTWGKENT